MRQKSEPTIGSHMTQGVSNVGGFRRLEGERESCIGSEGRVKLGAVRRRLSGLTGVKLISLIPLR